jgi:predicted O-linked N-acetylglucosamine transferase (SPINDLY family)
MTDKRPRRELELLSQGIDLLTGGYLTQAKTVFENVLREYRGSAEAAYLLGLTLLEMQHPYEAFEALKNAISLSPKDPTVMSALATSLYQLQRYREAADWYRAASVLAPDDFDILSGLAAALASTGDTDDALALYDQLLAQRPTDPTCLINRGNAYQVIKKHSHAIHDYRSALITSPDDALAHSYLARSLKELGNFREALEHLEFAKHLEPTNISFRFSAAQLQLECGLKDSGIAELKAILDLDPQNKEILTSVGTLYQTHGDHGSALLAYNKALSIDPVFSIALLNRGTVRAALGHLQDALLDYNQCVSLYPSYADAFFNRGNLHQRLHQPTSAETDFRHGLRIQPDHLGLNQNLAVLLFNRGRFSEAITFFKIVLEKTADKYDTLLNLGQSYLKNNDIQSSLECNEEALAIRPSGEYLQGLVLHQRMMLCDWTGWHSTIERLEGALRNGEPAAMPFHLLPIIDDPDLQLKCAMTYTSHRFKTQVQPSVDLEQHQQQFNNLHSDQTYPKKIRVGYFSSDFYRHATTLLISGMLEKHDKDSFEVIGYHFSSTWDDETERVRNACDKFYDVSLYTDQEVIKHAINQKLDIAIDLKGHTENSRFGVFSARIAPVQVNYLGYPGTTGNSCIDYIVADSKIIPPRLEPFYSERVIRLSPCYQPNDSRRPIADRVFSKAELGLPENVFVYCCFNNSYKITPTIFDAWMRILSAVPNSVLWLLSCNSTADRNLQMEAQRRGVDPSRLLVAPALPNPLHLSRLRNADLFLDTYPCSAHTTGSDCLWAGIPMVTIRGSTFASRVAASLLNAIGMREGITDTIAEYEARAIYFGHNATEISGLKKHLNDKNSVAPLFNTDSYARTWEQALRNIVTTSEPK